MPGVTKEAKGPTHHLRKKILYIPPIDGTISTCHYLNDISLAPNDLPKIDLSKWDAAKEAVLKEIVDITEKVD